MDGRREGLIGGIESYLSGATSWKRSGIRLQSQAWYYLLLLRARHVRTIYFIMTHPFWYLGLGMLRQSATRNFVMVMQKIWWLENTWRSVAVRAGQQVASTRTPDFYSWPVNRTFSAVDGRVMQWLTLLELCTCINGYLRFVAGK